MSARLFAAVSLGLALAIGGTIAVAGSSYTPPAASGGVEGDGTGVTDASAFRSALGLGTAATLTAGTSANNAVQLDGTGKLPAVDGSQLTGIAGGSGADPDVQVFTADDTWTEPASASVVEVICIGGGGGGAGGPLNTPSVKMRSSGAAEWR